MEIHQNEILNGVEKFHKRGTPGILVVFGQATVVLVTGDKEQDVVLVAAEYGKGRVAAFSHDQYGVELYDEKSTFDNSVIYENLRKWLSRKKQDIKMCFLKSSPALEKLEDLKKFDIIINTTNEKLPETLLEQYVKEGGGFVQAFTPWGWLQLNPGKSIIDVPYAQFLNNVGFAFWDGVVYNELKINRSPPCKDLVDSKSLQKQDEMKSLIWDASFVYKLCKLPMDQTTVFKPAILRIWEEVCCKVAPLCTADKVCSKNHLEKITLDTWCNLVSFQQNKALKAQGIRHFPGDYESLPPRKCVSVAFKSSFKETHVTSCHIPAGCIANLKVTSVKGKWKVVVGAHSDCLTDNCCRRWPIISKEVPVDECKSYQLSTPFGGSIYLLSPEQSDSHIEANIDDVVLCPRYDIMDLSLWNNSRSEPGLWADLSGKHVIFTFPSKCVRSMEDPRPVLELYDHLLEAYHDLKGTRIEDQRKMWVVSDEQPVAGYMHAGYPIVTHLDVTDPNKEAFLLNYKSFLEGKFWGIFHEMGHNMQETAWTFEGTSEVTVNIFTLYGMHTICKQPVLTHPWLKNQIKHTIQYLKDGSDFKKWQNEPGIALYVYAQLAHHFGWEAYKKVFRSYNELAHPPSTLQDCIDHWYVTFSEQVSKDLSPWTDFWGIPLSEAAREKLKDLPAHLPVDLISQLCPPRLEEIRRKYQTRLP